MRSNRIVAPRRFIQCAGQAKERHWWYGLTGGMIPFPAGGSNTGAGTTEAGHPFDIVRQKTANSDGGLGLIGEARGPVIYPVISGAGSIFPIDTVPLNPPLSIYAKIIKRYAGAHLGETLFATGFSGSGNGYAFLLDYGSGQIGLVRWGVSDHITTTLGAIPVNVESDVGLAWDGTTCRFFLNGKFENLSIAPVASPGLNAVGFMCYANFTTGSSGIGYYCAYAWNRVLSDNEFFALSDDPWRVTRGFDRSRHHVEGVAAPPGGSSIAGRGLIAVVGG